MAENKKILLLIRKSESSNIVYHYLKKHFGNIQVILEENPSKVRFLKRRIKRLGYISVFGQILFSLFIPKILIMIASQRKYQIIKKFDLNTNDIPPDSIIKVKSINSDLARNEIRNRDPEIIIINGTRIVGAETLNSTNSKFLNTHLGITPQYRGVHGGYWALVNNDKLNFGATVQFVDEGIDTGEIICQVKTTPSKKDNYSTYPLLQLAVTLPFLKDAVIKVKSGKLNPVSKKGVQSKLWYHPTIWQYLFYRIKFHVK